MDMNAEDDTAMGLPCDCLEKPDNSMNVHEHALMALPWDCSGTSMEKLL